MSDKVKTAEQVRDFISEVVEASVGEKLDELEKSNQEMVKNLRAEMLAEKREAEGKGKGLGAARFLRHFARAAGDQGKAIGYARKAGDEYIAKAMEATDATAGGVWVPEELSREVIELLRPATVVRRMGARSVPMPTGSISMTKLTGGATAFYVGEMQNIPETGQTTGKITMNWKKLTCMLPISNDLLKFETFDGDTMIRDDAVMGLAQRADLAFLYGDGTEHTPKGLYELVPTANKINANGTVNLTNVTQDLAKALLAMENANARMMNVGWIWAPTTEMYLRFLRDTNGNFVWADEMAQGTFLGFPFAKTTQVPYPLGSGSDESKVHLYDFADVLLGEAGALSVEASKEGTWHDGSSLRSAFAEDATLLRLIEHHDIACRHEESLVTLEATKWNPS